MNDVEKQKQLWRACGDHLVSVACGLGLAGIGGPLAVASYRMAGGIHLIEPTIRNMAGLPFEMIGAGWFLGGCIAVPISLVGATKRAVQAMRLQH